MRNAWGILLEKPEGRNNMGHISEDGRIIKKMIFKKHWDRAQDFKDRLHSCKLFPKCCGL
jgi:hypothetical protein